MELFAQLFDTQNVAVTECATSTLVSPMAALAASPVCLADVLSTDGSIVTGVLKNFASQNAPERSDKFSELSVLVAASDAAFLPVGEDSKRQLDFVYPVV